MLSRAPLAPHDLSGFSPDEQRWIDEVWALEEMQLLFGSNPSIPQVIFERLAVVDEDESAGLTEDGEFVSMGDSAYSEKRAWNPDGSDEVEFKSTLVHELFHVLVSENWIEGATVSGIVPPLAIQASIETPEQSWLGLAPYAFGWFVHPRERKWAHFQWDSVRGVLSPMVVNEQDEVFDTMNDPESWERSPDDRDPEEDAATCLGMYLTNQAGRDHLAQHFPLRYVLLQEYFKTVKLQAENAAGVPSVATP